MQAFTFELGKCYETAIRKRMLAVLANVDPDLCAGVATDRQACAVAHRDRSRH